MLNTNRFRADELVKVSGPPNLYRVEEGQFVQLVSGGPKMIVALYEGVAPDGTAVCQWLDRGRLEQATFKIVCLTAWPAADLY